MVDYIREEGFEVVDWRALEILPENAFGQPNPQNVQIIARSQFNDMELSEGLLVIFNDAASTELAGQVMVRGMSISGASATWS